MTKSQILLILANIYIASGIKNKKYALGISLFYSIGYIILGILGK